MSEPVNLRRGPDYREQPGCHCCAHCHVRQQPDQGPEYFCVIDQVPMPRPSRRAGEPYNAESEDAYYEELDRWEQGREVQAHAICSLFRTILKDNQHG